MSEISETPIRGSVEKTEWIDDGTILAWVTDQESGETWCETYTFEVAEKMQ